MPTGCKWLFDKQHDEEVARLARGAPVEAFREPAGPSGALAEGGGSAEAVRELKRLLRFCGERPGGAVCSERMEGAADARHAIRVEIRARLRLLQPNIPVCRADTKADKL